MTDQVKKLGDQPSTIISTRIVAFTFQGLALPIVGGYVSSSAELRLIVLTQSLPMVSIPRNSGIVPDTSFLSSSIIRAPCKAAPTTRVSPRFTPINRRFFKKFSNNLLYPRNYSHPQPI
ncbi:unnamed protein product [Ilex paraguariensis]|uniref:Uncharacterized protein n=1 Tax=Ilex paraguariensis TaxID=185542 RepID=A0ABC8R989_9AQUA